MTGVREACSESRAAIGRDGQFLFSFYNHARPSFDAQPMGSVLFGRMVPRARRIEVRSDVQSFVHTSSARRTGTISARRKLPWTPAVTLARCWHKLCLGGRSLVAACTARNTNYCTEMAACGGCQP